MEKKCAACSVVKPLTDFSKAQKKKGDLGRCKDCINASLLSNNASNNSNRTSEEPVAKRQKIAPVMLSCRVCLKSKKVSGFPKDCDKESPLCVQCIMDNLPRVCKDCNSSKPKDQFSEGQLTLPHDLTGNVHGQKTTLQIQHMIQSEQKSQICSDCERSRKEKAEKEAKEKRMKLKYAMKTHELGFYDFDNAVPEIVYSKRKPANLAGKYDVIFHYGNCMGDEVESRTTKGTAVLDVKSEVNAEHNSATVDSPTDVTGRVEFHEDLRLSATLCFQRDFDLSEGHYSGGSNWECAIKAMLIDQEARDIIHGCSDDEPAAASIKLIENRAACPRMTYEEPNDNEEEGDIVKFDTLEEAEILAGMYKASHDCTSSWISRHLSFPPDVAKRVLDYVCYIPKPVFFLEPGDLVLTINWSNDFREPVDTICVLRRRQN